MNYEELLAAKNEGKGNKIQQPIGCYYREQVEGKWCGVVDIRPDLNDNIVFVKALRNECEQNKNLTNHHQLHFTPVKEGNEVKRLELEKGNSVDLSGFGKFVVKEKAAHDGINPATKTKITIAAKKAVAFRPAKALKETVK